MASLRDVLQSLTYQLMLRGRCIEMHSLEVQTSSGRRKRKARFGRLVPRPEDVWPLSERVLTPRKLSRATQSLGNISYQEKDL